MIRKKKGNESEGTSTASLPVPMNTVTAVNLPKPRLGRGTSVSEALQLRKTTREMSDRKLPLQMLSNLLWAAFGVNRMKGPFDIPGRTAASASNSQEIDLYVALEEGVYLYDAFKHRLDAVIEGDMRALAIGPGQASLAMNAPVQLIYVADIDRLANTKGYQEPGLQDPEVQKSYYYIDTGLIAGNVFMFAASEGLAVWFHNCDKKSLKSELSLRPEQRALFAQTVGYPIER